LAKHRGRARNSLAEVLQPHKHHFLRKECRFELKHEASLEPDQGHGAQIDIDGTQDVLGMSASNQTPLGFTFLGSQEAYALSTIRAS
jgi:hypothetical protein